MTTTHQNQVHSDELRQRVVDLWVRSDYSATVIASMVGLTKIIISGMTHRFMRQRKYPSRGFLQAQCRAFPADTDWWKACPVFDHASNPTPLAPVKAHPAQLAANRGNGNLPKKAAKLKRAAIRVKTTPAGQGMMHQKMQLASAGSRGCREEQQVRKAERDALAQRLQTEFVQDWEAAEAIRQGHDLLSDPVPGEPTSILDLRHGMCRAVIGEHPRLPGGMYCGSKTTTKAYCAEHHQLFYTKHWKEPSIVRGLNPNKERGLRVET